MHIKPGGRAIINSVNRPAIRQSQGEEWTRSVDEWVATPPVVHGDTVVTKDVTGKLTAMDLKSGEKLWTKQSEGHHLNAVAVPNGPIVEHTRKELRAVDPKSGKELWSHLAAPKVGNPRVTSGGHLLVDDYLDSDDLVRRLDPQTGKTLWTIPASYTSYEAGPNHLLALNHEEGQLRVSLNTLDEGRELWSFKDSNTSPIGMNDTNVLLRTSGRNEDGQYFTQFSARDIETGELAWEYRHVGTSRSAKLNKDGDTLFVMTNPPDDYYERQLVALDANVGELKWSEPVGTALDYVLTDESVYVKSNQRAGDTWYKDLLALKPETGELLWGHNDPKHHVMAALQDGDLLQMTNIREGEGFRAEISRIDGVTGETEWTTSKGDLISEFRLGPEDSINLKLGLGGFTAIDPKNGYTVRDFQSEDTIRTVPANDGSGRVVVKEFGGDIRVLKTGPAGEQESSQQAGRFPSQGYTWYDKQPLKVCDEGVFLDDDNDGEFIPGDALLLWNKEGDDQSISDRVQSLEDLKLADKNGDGNLDIEELTALKTWRDWDGDGKYSQEDDMQSITHNYDRARLNIEDNVLERAQGSRAYS